MFYLIRIAISLTLALSVGVKAEEFLLSSQDIQHNKFMTKNQEYIGFGCTGKNLSPHLSWKNIPKGTKSFAITAYDPDAPTGSGWWHWQLVNIPVTTTELKAGAGAPKSPEATTGAMALRNDYSQIGFGGACPPKGHGVHHYRFTVHALSVDKLELPETASAALVGYMINANTIASSSITALYQRD